ncbi:hypothetical protein RF679_00320 [Undibacterium cyanobacteriorum]|uniref:APCDD1 domain-containing protein n=1 Tax=Undibacterium cyanobacteriorum TaxID=3073561 RepID=A0ABY9RHN8_9BURK|nr:hypothetical protein [Undibacterium sp. 20NA77.5]WMW80738.1 hypothetical protein RF679_00320 [Undibacterium sp. 20NA77.5]
MFHHFLSRLWASLILFLCSTSAWSQVEHCRTSTDAQENRAVVPQTLTGRLVFRQGLRSWFELKLDRPYCGQASLQLIADDQSKIALERFRDCRVETRGVIDTPDTGYYSAAYFQSVTIMKGIDGCELSARFPDYSKYKPTPGIRYYRVDFFFRYGDGERDTPINVTVTHKGRKLRPWQAYASYYLTGGFALYGSCAESYVLGRVSGTVEGHPGHFDELGSAVDKAAYDPESAAAAGVHQQRLTYTCVRKN